MALRSKKKLVWSGAAIFALLLVGAGVFAYLLTRDLDAEFAQDPNSVEAHEAKRKLKLFSDAQAGKRKGFVRLSEVEINSFLDPRYNKAATTSTNTATNAPAKVVKRSVLLGSSSLTFVSWHTTDLFGMQIPLVVQRTVTPFKDSTNGWSFASKQVRIGRLDLPERLWPEVEKIFGKEESFIERESWLAKLPAIALAKNELNQAPELRLYTYVPDKGRP